MPANNRYPKFQDKIQGHINTAAQQAVQPNIGVIITYDPMYNTAQVMMTQRGSETMGEVFNNVPCPRPMGVQSTAPEQGCQCIVMFKDGKRGTPYIVSYMNTTSFQAVDYARHNTAINNTPTFMMGL